MAKKINHKSYLVIAQSRNFSEFQMFNGDSNSVGFDPDDKGEFEDKLYSSVEADNIILEILTKLDDRQKVIFLYQLLRASGYNFTHADCAQTVGVTKEWYMGLLKEVRMKVYKTLQKSLK